MIKFYHVSKTKIPIGSFIKRTRTPADWRKDLGYTNNYCCLAFDKSEALFWINVLSQSPNRGSGTWYLHEVGVPKEEKVELCLAGVFYNFGKGMEGTAEEIKSLAPVPEESEVIITTDNSRVLSVESIEHIAFQDRVEQA